MYCLVFTTNSLFGSEPNRDLIYTGKYKVNGATYPAGVPFDDINNPRIKTYSSYKRAANAILCLSNGVFECGIERYYFEVRKLDNLRGGGSDE